MDPYDSDSNIDLLRFNMIDIDTIKRSDHEKPNKIKRKKKNTLKSDIIVKGDESISCLCIVDLDDTLIDKHNRVMDGAKKFLVKLNIFNNAGYNILWSFGNKAHVMHQWELGFSNFFDNVIIGYAPGLKDCGKPITHAKKCCNQPRAFLGPSIIIDNDPSNIRNDQYDIAINVSKYFINKPGTPLAVNYNAIYDTLITKVREWYKIFDE